MNNKRIIQFLLVTFLVTTVGQALLGNNSVSAAEKEVNVSTGTATDTATGTSQLASNFEYHIDKDTNTIAVTGYKGTDEVVKIPEEINGIKVTKIEKNEFCKIYDYPVTEAFVLSDSVKKLIIPSSVERIEDDVFGIYNNLKEIQFSEGLKYIGDDNFKYSNFTNIRIPESVEYLGMNLFDGSCKLEEITIPTSIKVISNNMLNNCSNLKKVNMRSDINIQCSKIFYGSKYASENLDSNNLLVINNKLCCYYGDDEEIVIPDNVDEITDNTFFNNEKIKKVTMKRNVEYIGHDAFSNCKNLSEVNIENKDIQICDNSFRWDTCIINIQGKKNNIQDLNYSNFEFDKDTGTITGYRGNTTYLYIPENINGVKVKAIIPSNELLCKGYGILGNNKTVQGIYFEFGCKNILIGKCAFQNSININYIQLQGTHIVEPYAFYNCSKLNEITQGVKYGKINSIDSENNVYVSRYSFVNSPLGKKMDLVDSKDNIYAAYDMKFAKEGDSIEPATRTGSNATATNGTGKTLDNTNMLAFFGAFLGSFMLVFKKVKSK